MFNANGTTLRIQKVREVVVAPYTEIDWHVKDISSVVTKLKERGVDFVLVEGHGAWLRTSNREFLFTFRQIFYNADGSYAGGAKVRNAATLDVFANNMNGQLIVQYYDAADQLVFTGTGTFTATRIVAESLSP